MRSRLWILAAAIGVVAVTGTAAALFSKEAPAVAAITVYKDPNCGCCAKWVDHLRQNGFTVKVEDTDQMAAVKQRLGVGQALASCHTAVVGDYVFEGHIPADAIQKFLANPPAGARGLAVPGMPMGSPGMESANPQPYDVLQFDPQGATKVFDKR
ncbi:MAG: DUF411 domain-containing protein [Longimicrobiales bacterium]